MWMNCAQANSSLSHKIYYSQPFHSTHNCDTRFSKLNLTTPKSTTAAGHRRVEYQCLSMWNRLPVTIRTVAEELGFRRLLKEHPLDNLCKVTCRLSTNWSSALWLAAVLLRRALVISICGLIDLRSFARLWLLLVYYHFLFLYFCYFQALHLSRFL